MQNNDICRSYMLEGVLLENNSGQIKLSGQF
jgi:hypothetical protein